MYAAAAAMEEKMKRFFVLALLACPVILAQAPEEPVVLTIDVENYVAYRGDVLDPAKVAKDTTATTGQVLAFLETVQVGDIVAVNGKPAKGLYQTVGIIMPFRANPIAGQPISDLNSTGFFHCSWEILGPDGAYIGTLSDGGAGAGHGVMGGIGAFLGVNGAHTAETLIPQRSASTSEDPSKRRINGAGGRIRATFYLYPTVRPTVLTTATGPVVAHVDYAPVTAANPARPSERLIIAATGLGPVKPGIQPPGTAPFSGSPYQEVNSPVTVTFNGKELPVIDKIGWPGQKDLYWLDFQVPSDAGTGTATLQLTAAWIPGPVVSIPVGSR
jgi:uncharacterized protein (TIGR03437 family)